MKGDFSPSRPLLFFSLPKEEEEEAAALGEVGLPGLPVLPLCEEGEVMTSGEEAPLDGMVGSAKKKSSSGFLWKFFLEVLKGAHTV